MRNWISPDSSTNKAIRTNHIKARIDKTQQNSRCRLCSDRDDTVNHIISECNKLAQKEYKTRHNWLGEVIRRELCKKLKFDLTNKWYMHNPESFLWKWDTQTPLRFWDTNGSPNFDQTTKPHNNQHKRENLQNCGLSCPNRPQSKIERKQKEG